MQEAEAEQNKAERKRIVLYYPFLLVQELLILFLPPTPLQKKTQIKIK